MRTLALHARIDERHMMTFTSEFATAFRNLLAQAFLLEIETTARVLEAIPKQLLYAPLPGGAA